MGVFDIAVFVERMGVIGMSGEFVAHARAGISLRAAAAAAHGGAES